MTMTLDSFYETLTGLGLTWLLSSGIAIRCEAGDCPIIAVHKAKFGDLSFNNCSWLQASKDLGLNPEDMDVIIDAADGSFGSIRSSLLAACNL